MAGSVVVLDPVTAAELRRRERAAFVDGVAVYQASLAELGRADRHALLSLASLEPGRALLDVCTGPGWVAIEAAQLCPGMTVTGVDMSPAMVDLARAHASSQRVAATFAVMDAEQLEFDDASFDRVMCGWGLMHVPDPITALSEMARVTRSGGLLATSVWGPASGTVQGILAEALREGSQGRAALDYGYLTRLGDEAVISDALADSGWCDSRMQLLQREFVVAEAEMVWMGMGGGTTFGTLVADLEERDQDAARSAFVKRCEAYRQPDGIHVPMSQMLVTARR